MPSKAFTCAGRIVKWRAAGDLATLDQLNSRNAKVRIWRPTNNQAEVYARTKLTIELSRCEDNKTVSSANKIIHKCELSSLAQVPVQIGDIVALELPRSRRRVFTLFFNTTDGPDNYEFFLTSSNTSVHLSDAVKVDQALPLLSLTVETDNSMATSSNEIYYTTERTETTQPTDYTFENGTESNNKTAIDDDTADSTFTVNIATFVGLGLMSVIIAILVLALVCSIRKNRKLRRQMTQRQLSPSEGLSSKLNMEMILNGNREDVSPSSIVMEDNVTYNQSMKSDGNDYVINELVYASIGECDKLQLESGSPNTYMTILDPTTTEQES